MRELHPTRPMLKRSASQRPLTRRYIDSKAASAAKSCALLHPKSPLQRPNAAQVRENAPHCAKNTHRPTSPWPGDQNLPAARFSPRLASHRLLTRRYMDSEAARAAKNCARSHPKPPLRRQNAAQSREVARNCAKNTHRPTIPRPGNQNLQAAGYTPRPASHRPLTRPSSTWPSPGSGISWTPSY